MSEDKKGADVSDEDIVKEGKTRDRVARKQELDDVKAVMDIPGGRRFMARLIYEVGGLNRLSMTGNAWTHFNEGERNVAIKVLSEIDEACPELYYKMIEENRDK